MIFFSKFSFLNVVLLCLTSLEWVNMFGALIIGNNFFPYKSHRKLMEKCHRDDHDGDDAPNLYLTLALPNYNAWRGLKLMYFGLTMFLHHSQKMSKIL